MADDKKPDPRDAKIAELEAKLAAQPALTAQAIGEAVAIGVARAMRPENIAVAKLRKNEPLAEKYKGEKTYIVGASGHFRGNKRYVKGEKVTVTNERPARDWVLYDPNGPAAVHQADAAPAPAGRANDRNVGG